jgi:hypothetical protein
VKNVKTVSWLCALCASLAFTSIAFAQHVEELPPGPGTVFKYDIHFSGPDADKIKSIQLYFQGQEGVPRDQPGFAISFNSGWIGPDGHGTFHVEAKAPENVATNNYILYVNGQLDVGGQLQYAGGKDFPFTPVHITNDKKIQIPAITVTPAHP